MPKTHFLGPGDSLEMGACSNGSRSGERGGPRVEGRRRLQMKSARVSSEGRRMAVRSSWFWKPPRVGSEVEVIRRFYFFKVFGARLCIDEPVLLARHSRALFEALRAFGRGAAPLLLVVLSGRIARAGRPFAQAHISHSCSCAHLAPCFESPVLGSLEGRGRGVASLISSRASFGPRRAGPKLKL